MHMAKIEIFIPRPGMTQRMEDYFKRDNVLHLSGSPVSAEAPEDNLTEEQLIELAVQAAQVKLDSWGQGADYEVVRDVPFIDQFTDDEGNFIGWEFEFMLWETEESFDRRNDLD